MGVAVAGLAAALVVSGCSAEADEPFSGTTLEDPFSMPDVTLTSDTGEDFSLTDDTDKRLTLVFFGYVDCVDICPAVLDNIASAFTYLDEEDLADVDLVMVTSNPERDTPERLHDYLQPRNPSFVGLTGSWDTIEQVGDSLKTYLERDDPAAHQTLVYGLDSADEVPVYWGADTTPKQYASDIHALLQN